MPEAPARAHSRLWFLLGSCFIAGQVDVVIIVMVNFAVGEWQILVENECAGVSLQAFELLLHSVVFPSSPGMGISCT